MLCSYVPIGPLDWPPLADVRSDHRHPRRNIPCRGPITSETDSGQNSPRRSWKETFAGEKFASFRVFEIKLKHLPGAMKFGKDFRIHLEETLPDWRDKFLCYKPLKKLIKNLPPDGDDGADGRPWIGLEEWFVRILDEELEKFNDFYVDKEEEFVIRLQELKERIERVKARQSGAFKSESEFGDEMLEIRKAFVAIHGEMVLLKNYSSLNFAGLVKILKKYDKRTGGLLSLPFTRRALHQPFFTTEPLTRLVHERIRTKSSGNKNTDTETSSCLREDADDIYRSTLAAMKAIQGLRRASSTYNPLSLGQFFRCAGDDCSAALTSEDSNSNCTSMLQRKEDDEESVRSDDH
ncbi:SPX domain-containing protein 4 [Apostasia shenzhenica]|uniref:SPX domain-containing protein 4 n=1 Tax=Apostasia shenzhenica TaxID=1088818 RepID=A0A2I0AAV4_9ASPA|nr:SPX domain-containing protein 4 [Apostasia shenzhenica]